MATLDESSNPRIAEGTPSDEEIQRLFEDLYDEAIITFVIGRALVGKSKWIAVSCFGMDRVVETPIDPQVACSKASDYAAIQQFLSEDLHVPTPKVLAFDSSAQNAISAPYLIRECPYGTPLSVYDDFGQQDRWDIIPQLGDWILSIQQHIPSFNIARILSADWIPDKSTPELSASGVMFYPGNSLDQHPIKLCPFTAPGNASVSTLKYTSLSEFLIGQLLAWGMVATPTVLKAMWGTDTCQDDGRNLLQLVQGMKILGFFKDDQPNALWYRGLDESNFFVARINGKVQITGVAGWNEIVSVPQSIAREDPMWFRNFKSPETPDLESRKIKVALDRYLEQKSPGWTADAKEFGTLVRIVAGLALGDTSSKSLRRVWLIPEQRFWYMHSHFNLPRDFVLELFQEWKRRFDGSDTEMDIQFRVLELRKALQNNSPFHKAMYEHVSEKFWTPKRIHTYLRKFQNEQHLSYRAWLNKFA
ncbi:MAG: hypothetical protein Q9174_004785 [Haloplaca sp. 1 TL-2023]